ncbi:MAG: hypothetical protein RL112_628 [Planctomycetota bacterium]
MRTEKSLGPVDWLALVVFVAGSFGLVLMGLSAISGDELAAPHGTARVAIEWIAAIGLAPSLLFNAAVAYLGARTFLRSHARGLLRDFLGSTAVALGASVACGVFAAGGALGEATGGALAASSNKALAAIAGAFAIVVPAWIAWLRAAAIKPAPLVKADATGVGGAETAALAGDDEVLATAQPTPLAAPTRVAREPLAHPYPDDARLRGEIPPGTKPLIVSASMPVEAVETQGLAGDFDASFDDEPVVVRPLEPRDSAAATMVEADEALDQSAAELSSALEALESGAAGSGADEAEAPSPVVPSWERTGLTSEDEPVDAYGTPLSLVEKVRAEVAARSEATAPRADGQAELDALEAELLALEQAQATEEQRASALLSASAEDGDEDGDEIGAEAETVELAVARQVVAAEAVAEEANLESDDGSEDELEVVHDEDQPVEDEDQVGEEEPEVEEHELDEVVAVDEDAQLDDEDVLEEALAEEVVAEEVESDELDAEQLEVLAEAQVEVEVQSPIEPVEPALDAPVRVAAEIGFDERSAQANLDEEPVEEAPAASSPSSEVEDASAPKRSSRKKSKAPAEAAAPSLFDGGLFASEEVVAEVAASASAEPQVELQPQAGAPGASIKQLALDPSRKDLLDEVGCLFVERGRVAVSMLQKQYGMDFDEACVVLDDLQELGLIGPYLGGQRRDILLTRDQWKERLAKA